MAGTAHKCPSGLQFSLFLADDRSSAQQEKRLPFPTAALGLNI